MKMYLTCMGDIYETTKTKYKRYLQQVARDGSADLSQYAKHVGKAYSVTDITREDAQLILDGGRCSWLPLIEIL